MEILFWVSAATIFYVYAGYPLMLALWARLCRRSATPARRRRDTVSEPPVSIVIAVRDEALRLRARVENLLAQQYAAPIEVIVVSDGSIDDPEAALAGLSDAVRLIECPARGKAAALNVGVAAARHDVLVFADARQRFAPDAIHQLTAAFDDPTVGGVTGELLLDAEQGAPDVAAAPVAEGVGMYWRYEKALRRMESTVGSTLGATGAIYALRRALWRPLPEDTLLDDVLAPMRAVLAGYRVVFADRAKAFDYASRDASTESRRKIRTLAGNVQILWLEPRLLVPFVNPVWLQYVSHKLGRLVVPYALVAALVSSAALAGEHWVYALALMAQTAFYLLAIYGAWLTSPALEVNGVQDA